MLPASPDFAGRPRLAIGALPRRPIFFALVGRLGACEPVHPRCRRSCAEGARRNAVAERQALLVQVPPASVAGACRVTADLGWHFGGRCTVHVRLDLRKPSEGCTPSRRFTLTKCRIAPFVAAAPGVQAPRRVVTRKAHQPRRRSQLTGPESGCGARQGVAKPPTRVLASLAEVILRGLGVGAEVRGRQRWGWCRWLGRCARHRQRGCHDSLHLAIFIRSAAAFHRAAEVKTGHVAILAIRLDNVTPYRSVNRTERFGTRGQA